MIAVFVGIERRQGLAREVGMRFVDGIRNGSDIPLPIYQLYAVHCHGDVPEVTICFPGQVDDRASVGLSVGRPTTPRFHADYLESGSVEIDRDECHPLVRRVDWDVHMEPSIARQTFIIHLNLIVVTINSHRRGDLV